MKATNITLTTGTTRKINRNNEMSSMTAVCPGCSLNSEMILHPAFRSIPIYQQPKIVVSEGRLAPPLISSKV